MSIKGNIRKILFVTLWSVIGTGALVLLIAAINNRSSRACKGYDIQISSAAGKLFVDKKEVAAILTKNGNEKLTGKAIASFNLRQLEDSVSKNPWVGKAQVFFDNNEILRVNITEREPVARIFTVGGNSFYIDSSGVQLPLSDKAAVKIPVFTSYPYEKIKTHGSDSVMLLQMKKLSGYIKADSFWMAQVAQVDITPAKTFEMMPVIGNHVIEFGDGSDYEKKFRRLFVFYKDVLSKSGFDKYSRINVAYTGQVIGTKKGSGITKADSLLAIKNIQQLIKSARLLQADTARNLPVEPVKTDRPFVSGDFDSAQNVPAIIKPNPPLEKPKPVIVQHAKPTVISKPTSKPPVKKPTSVKPVSANQKPKAVMLAKS